LTLPVGGYGAADGALECCKSHRFNCLALTYP